MGDDPIVRRLLDEPNTEQIHQLIEEAEIVFVDEAQRLLNIGLTAKIITDQFKAPYYFNEIRHTQSDNAFFR